MTAAIIGIATADRIVCRSPYGSEFRDCWPHSLQPFRESADNTVSKHRFLAKSLAADCRLIVRLSLVR